MASTLIHIFLEAPLEVAWHSIIPMLLATFPFNRSEKDDQLRGGTEFVSVTFINNPPFPCPQKNVSL